MRNVNNRRRNRSKEIKSNKGITLIALVITIIVLLILAGVSIIILWGDHGILKTAQDATTKFAIEAEREKIDNVRIDWCTKKATGENVTVEDFFKMLEPEIIDNIEQDVTGPEDNNTYIVETNSGYTVEVTIGEDGNIQIGNIEKGKLEIRITKLTLKEKENGTDVEVTIEVKQGEGVTYKYYCKEKGQCYGEAFYVGTDLKSKITGLDLENKEYEIRVEAIKENKVKSYKEGKVGDIDTIAAVPALAEGMIPVKYEGNKWVRTTANDSNWYSYTKEDKRWANIVLGDAKFDEDGNLNTSEPYSQFVWIPRYAYKIVSGYHCYERSPNKVEVKIKFIDTSNRDSKEKQYSIEYPAVTNSGKTDGSMDDYVVHPAFNFDGTATLSGIWVGKYLNSYVGAPDGTVDGLGSKPESLDATVAIRHDWSPWTGTYVSDCFDICMKMASAISNSTGKSVYGFKVQEGHPLEVDTHLIKNDEFGSICYLTESNYGDDTWKNITMVQPTKIAWEIVSAYVENDYTRSGSKNLLRTTVGKSIIDAHEKQEGKKYVNVYRTGYNDTYLLNYRQNSPTSGIWGDFIWEVTGDSGTAISVGYPYDGSPFFIRSTNYAVNQISVSGENVGFRTVLVLP